VVEFALVLPFFMVTLLLSLDAGFLVFDKAMITNATREGARAAVVLSSSTWAQARAAALSAACASVRGVLISTGSGTRASDCTGTSDPVIEASNPNGNDPPRFGDPITVSISWTYPGLLRSVIAPVHGAAGSSVTVESGWAIAAATTMVHE
jgi:Flp pilus assembly protein TadG